MPGFDVLGAVAAPPAAGAAVMAAAGVFLILIATIALGLHLIWTTTIGSALRYLGDKIGGVGFSVAGTGLHPFGPVRTAFHYVDRKVDSALVSAFEGAEAGASWLFSQSGNIIEWTAREIADLATAAAVAVARVAVAIPSAVGRAAYAQTVALIEKLKATALRAMTVALAHVERGLSGLDKLFHDQAALLRRGIDRIGRIATHDLPQAIGRVRARVATLEHRVGSLAFGKSLVKRVAGTAAFAAAVGFALSRLGLRWLRCSNVTKAGRRICGMNPGLLDELLLGVVALGISFNLREFAEDVQAVTDESAKIIRRIVA